MKFYISRIRQPDGSWVVDPEPLTKKEAGAAAKFNRIIGGLTTQIWTLEEAIERGFEVNQPGAA